MAEDSVIVKKEKQGFLKKMGNSFAGIPIGLLLLIFGVIFLGNNEKANVNNIKDVKELRSNIIDISSKEINKKNDSKLVALSGKLNYGENGVVDSLFNVSASSPKLKRIVEMYQWVEDKKETDDKVTYSYSKEWSTKIIDSSEFNTTTGHENKTEMPYEEIIFVVDEDLKVGEFTLINSFKDLISVSDDYKNYENVVLPEGYTINNEYITNSVNVLEPQVGDIRVSYKVANYSDVSVIGKQIGDEIGAYDTKTNSSIIKLYKGTKNANQMINSIESSNKASKWIKRVIGTLLIIFGVSLVLGPITTLIGYIPFLGNIVNSMIGIVSFIIGLSISLLVIAISWFVVRPVLSIILVAAISLLIVGLVYIKKNKTKEVTN